MKTGGRLATAVCLGIVAVVAAVPAWAGGVEILENGRGQGNSNAGVRATADDASTVWWNPAGMARFDRSAVAASGHVIFSEAEFEDAGSYRLNQPAFVPLLGELGETSETLPAGGLFGIYSINKCWKLGLGITAPFGLTTDWGRTWVGRYHATRSSLLTININPSVAWRINHQWSVAAGVNFMYADAELGNSIDFGAALGAPQTADGHVKVEGDSWGYGWNVGFLWEPTQCTRVGVHYRSRVKQEISGTAEYEVPAAAAPIVGATGRFRNTSAETEVTLPDTAGISVYHQLNPRWALLADLTWTGWSTFEELNIDFGNPAEPNSITPWDWNDTVRLAVGANYQLNSCWLLRTGLAYDQSPIPTETRTPRMPTNDRFWVSVGATWRASRHWSLDFHYTHVFMLAGHIDQQSLTRGALIGDVEGGVDVLGLQVNYDF